MHMTDSEQFLTIMVNASTEVGMDGNIVSTDSTSETELQKATTQYHARSFNVHATNLVLNS